MITTTDILLEAIAREREASRALAQQLEDERAAHRATKERFDAWKKFDPVIVEREVEGRLHQTLITRKAASPEEAAKMWEGVKP